MSLTPTIIPTASGFAFVVDDVTFLEGNNSIISNGTPNVWDGTATDGAVKLAKGTAEINDGVMILGGPGTYNSFGVPAQQTTSGTIAPVTPATNTCFVNDAGATLDLTGLGGFITPDQFDNAGTLVVAMSPSVSINNPSLFSTVFTNTGTVSLQSGNLILYGNGVTSASSLLVAAQSTLTFGNGAIYVITGGAYQVAGTTLLDPYAALRFAASGSISAAIVNNGTIEAINGTLTITQSVAGTGTLQVDAGATLDLAAAPATGQAIAFAGANATLALSGAASGANTISGFVATDRIDLVGLAATSASVGTGQIVVQNGSETVATLQTPNFSLPTGTHLSVASDGAGGSIVSLIPNLTDVYVDASGATAYTTLYPAVTVQDRAANVLTYLDQLQSLSAAGKLLSIQLTDAAPPTLDVTVSQLAADAGALSEISGTYNLVVTGVTAGAAASVADLRPGEKLALSDSAFLVATHLDVLENLAAAGKLASISLTDSGTPELALSPEQITNDTQALTAITGSFTLSFDAVGGSLDVTGVMGHGTTVVYEGNADQYVVTPVGNGVGLTVTGGGRADQFADITALQFADQTEIIAQTPGSAAKVTTGNIAELYAAVLAREPDVAGLAFYQAALKANPQTPLNDFAEWFLSSSEYTSNPAHAYAQSSAGDAQFITDIYANLLKRAPDTGAVAFYQTNVINSYLTGLTPGTAAYASAELAAHAMVLVYISQSPEFLGDVQITAQHPADAQHWLVLI